MALLKRTPGKLLSTFSLVMINVIAVDSLRTLTAGAVRAFQLKKGLAVDGEVGALTAKALGVAWL